MSIRNLLNSIIGLVPTQQRRWLKSLYEETPVFIRKTYYSQYGEDAFLQAYFQQKLLLGSSEQMALSSVLRKAIGPGFYVDIGANSPVLYSNTYWFYRKGWRGINIDAAPGSVQIFERKRPRDINLEALISDKELELTFFHWGTPYGVNTLSPEHAEYFTRLTGRQPTKITLRSSRLDTLLTAHLPLGQPISFMSIDVEGHDLHVLRSNDWERYRPELVLVEDFKMDVANVEASEIYRFMRSVGYEMYAWLRPTVVYRQIGLRDWLVPEHD